MELQLTKTKTIQLLAFFLCVAAFLALPRPAAAGGLFQQAGPSIFLGEVQSYGDDELKARYFDTFSEKLGAALADQGLAYTGSVDLTNEEGRHAATGAGGEAGDLSEIHMDAIVHGHQYDRGDTAAKLAHYADAVMGRGYFHDEERLKAWHGQPDATYALSPDKRRLAKAIADRHGAQYLLFINIKDVDVRLKHGIFASHTDRETKGKKMKSSLDYYLVNAATGRVYEHHFEDKKSAQLINFGLGKTGKGMAVDTLLGEVLEGQAQALAKDLAKRVKAGVK
ncbi:hypothetical protein [uncultured Selenomonas sp.]|uniref:hypothetical protein n=1 Tax=uncultured Selenomonas sp. TaxID=159275 RepID=UPI0025D0119B|nr:hypothetical protein [uncultured Selenomonas sp.]